ncbi:hypothetical protein WG926_24055 [Tistrella sp. BH-R2-4]|jgi:hypothetical protein|uniref:Uncharacterized protein n=1 Tax=Tistrella arctica TaxID=3133430 RepID=A0ABU9YRG1_9PROT
MMGVSPPAARDERGEHEAMPEEDEIDVTITISRKAFEKATRLAADKDAAGDFAGLMTAEEYIEQLVEIALED